MTIKVNTVPNANWHDAMFTQFAARKTDFDIAILDSQHIGEAVTNGNILDLTDFVKENIDVEAYNPYLLAAYGQYPQAETGKRDENASLYGLPLLGDTWTMIYRKDLIGDKPPQTWDEMIVSRREVPGGQPRRQRAGLPPGQRLRRRGRHLQHGQRRLRRQPLERQGHARSRASSTTRPGQEAMDVLVNKMKPLTAKGSGNWFIDEVNAAVAQGKACIAFQWIAASGGLLDPKQSTLGTTPGADSRQARLRHPADPEDEPGASRRHGDARVGLRRQGEPGGGPELHEVVRAGRHPEEVGRGRRRAIAYGRPASRPSSSTPGRSTRCTPTRCPRMRDMWNVPEYARLVDIENTNVNAALNGAKKPKEALDDIAKEQQSVLDSSRRKGGGGL